MFLPHLRRRYHQYTEDKRLDEINGWNWIKLLLTLIPPIPLFTLISALCTHYIPLYPHYIPSYIIIRHSYCITYRTNSWAWGPNNKNKKKKKVNYLQIWKELNKQICSSWISKEVDLEKIFEWYFLTIKVSKLVESKKYCLLIIISSLKIQFCIWSSY